MKKCYECNKDMNNVEIVKGMLRYDILQNKALNEGWEFEGWVHVTGGNEYFVRDETLNNLYLEEGKRQHIPDDERDVGLMDRLIVCEECVEEAFERERV